MTQVFEFLELATIIREFEFDIFARGSPRRARLLSAGFLFMLRDGNQNLSQFVSDSDCRLSASLSEVRLQIFLDLLSIVFWILVLI